MLETAGKKLAPVQAWGFVGKEFKVVFVQQLIQCY
jgi:hypothetical protein